MWMSMEDGASGTLNVEGGEVLLGGSLGIHYRGSTGNTAINITDGSVLTCSRIYQRSGSSAVNVLIDDGILRAYADRTDFLPNASYLTVKVGNGGATFDCDGHDITIAKAIEDVAGESGPVTFAGNDGKIRLTGALNTTGAIKLCDRTHLIAADSTMKAAILNRGITVVKPLHGSEKGTYTIFSVADGTPCTDADLANVTIGPGLTGAALSIVDGAITITVTHSLQTWSGSAGTSAPWSGPNWDGGELFDDGNEALLATANAIAEVDAAANAAYEDWRGHARARREPRGADDAFRGDARDVARRDAEQPCARQGLHETAHARLRRRDARRQPRRPHRCQLRSYV